MTGGASNYQLVLDVNFPVPIVRAVEPYIKGVNFVSLDDIDSQLRELDDRDLLRALHQEGYEWLVTNDTRMLQNPEEIAAIMKSKVSVFAVKGAGHDPVRATGALLLDLPGALKRAQSFERPAVFRSAPRNPDPQKPWDFLKRAAEHLNVSVTDLFNEVRMTDAELDRSWREGLD